MTLLETQPDCDAKTTPKPRHGRRGSLPPGSPRPADPLDRETSANDGRRDGPDLARHYRKILARQRNDLAMLRSSFRRLVRPPEPPAIDTDEIGNDEALPAGTGKTKRAGRAARSADPKAPLTAGEFSHLVTAMARHHEAEREAFAPVLSETKPDSDQVEYEKLSQMSKPELIELCREHRIGPPDLCDA